MSAEPTPIDIEYRERLFRVTDSFEELPDVGMVVMIKVQLLGVEPPLKGTDWLAVSSTVEQVRAAVAALADRMLVELAGRN